MTKRQVLITDGETRAAVAVARGLADAGFDVVAASADRSAPARWSRSVAGRLVVPDPLREEAGFLAALEHIVRCGRISALVAGSDASLLAISRGRERLEGHIRTGLPDHEQVWRSLDKTVLADAARRHAVEAPPTTVCRSHAAAADTVEKIGFPVVAKPMSSVVEDVTPRRRVASRMVADGDELAQVVAEFGGAVLIQQHVPGPVVSFAGVLAGERLLAEAVSRYHRTWHPTGGSACYSETIAAPALLRGHVIDLLVELGWEGMFELELIPDADSHWRAIDLNPRPYGSLALAIGAGANLPAIWCQHLLGETPTPVRAAAGVFYRWTDADLRHGLWQLRAGRVSAAADVLRVRRGVVHPYGRAGDPGPAAARMLAMGQLAIERGHQRRSAALGRSPVVVIGAGPYGLAAVAHLRHMGIDTQCFGEPLKSWSSHMPAGMLLRSSRHASHIANPRSSLMIDDYERAEDRRTRHPSLTLEQFIAYGRWFAQQAVPDVDTRRVTEVARGRGGFRLRLQDGEEVHAARVIVAAGVTFFMNCPAPFASLPRWARSHSYEHDDLRGFSGRRVAVIGSGQSALEYAALLNEAGSNVEVLARSNAIHWLADATGDEGSPAARRPRASPLSPPPTGVGGRVTGWIAAMPDVFRHAPRALHEPISLRCIRPAGSAWLRPRLADVPITCATRVIDAQAHDDAVRLDLSDGSTRTVDHVLLGTGYTVDVRRYPFLSDELTAALQMAGGYPVLGPGLESSVAGLHFMGASAAHSFGPIMRFVVGTWYAAPAVARRAAGRLQPPVRLSLP